MAKHVLMQQKKKVQRREEIVSFHTGIGIVVVTAYAERCRE